MSLNATPGSGPPTKKNEDPIPPLKQIRFVPSNGQPHTKRRRINAACQTCRKRKTRCSGERPECKTCIDNGNPCGGYVDTTTPQPSQTASSDIGDEKSNKSSVPSQLKPAQTISREDREHVCASSTMPTDQGLTPNLPNQSSTSSSSSVKAEASGAGFASRPDLDSPGSNHTSVSMSSARNRVPYFRYFGPSAIVPGFKQMVVQMKERRTAHSLSGKSPSPSMGQSGALLFRRTSANEFEQRNPVEIPLYDVADPAPNPPIITHLCETFFTHLGCNYPFLQRERFLRDLEEKCVDAILVDAVCAVAARFSSDPLLLMTSGQSIPVDAEKDVQRPFKGHVFAQRAMAAVVDTFSCPTIAVAQACLLLAYEEFGSDHDSGLWMFLGTSIRMAQDLGMQKLEGLQLEGRRGPTPKTAKLGAAGKEEEKRREEHQRKMIESGTSKIADGATLEDRRASEQERIDTFYCIFLLDRFVSSGTGRPVTLRDKDIEISFPFSHNDESIDGWPPPFPPLIRIVHLYGRVTDVLNNIKEVNQVTPEILMRLGGMEKDLTGIYQRLSPKLHFNATNFQHYVKSQQGTTFILLHFWFHTLIVLLHQPTLLHSFEGRIQQLFPDSRELSMSSAKTIADILAFAELIDVKSFIGNPFTSQPMYIAASAFLMEAAAHTSQPVSRGSTPPDQPLSHGAKLDHVDTRKMRSPLDERFTAKHTLLATAANQNYQRCYKALKALETYWAGTRYIVTVLDQKSKGIMDPLLFTSEDLDSEMPSNEPAFTTPGWRRSTSTGAPGTFCRLRGLGAIEKDSSWSPKIDPSNAIGWSLTGTTNSPNPNLSFLYHSTPGEPGAPSPPPVNPNFRHKYLPTHKPLDISSSIGKGPLSRMLQHPNTRPSSMDQVASLEQRSTSNMLPPQTKCSPIARKPVTAAEANLLLGLHSPSIISAPRPSPNLSGNYSEELTPLQLNSLPAPNQASFLGGSTTMGTSEYLIPTPFSDMMMIESQDIERVGSLGGFAFPSGDMIPWLEYLPQDILSYFGDPPDDGSLNPPEAGPGSPAQGS